MKRRYVSSALPTLLILLLAFALRLWGIADHSIWWDEGRSASMARSSITEIIRLLANGNHPPLHYIFLRVWWLLVGDGEFVMRYPSTLFGLLWVVLTYRLGSMLGKRKAAQLGALLLAISRFAIVWSQQIRMYTWSTVWTTLVMITALRYWRRERWQILLVYVISASAGLLSLYLTVSSVLTVNLVFLGVWLIKDRKRSLLLQWSCAQLGVVAIVSPWLILNASQAETWTILAPITLFEYLRLYISMLVVGNPLDISATMFLTMVAVIVFFCSCIVIIMQQRRIAHKVGFITLCLGLVVQGVVVYAVCFGIVPGFARPLVPRYLLLLSTGFYVVTGWGISILSSVPWVRYRRSVANFLVGLFLISQLIGLSTLYPGRLLRDDFVSIANILQAMRYPEDGVLLYVDRDWPVFEAHYSGERHAVPYGMDINKQSVDSLLSPLWNKHEAIWVVMTPQALNTDPNQLITTWLDEHAISSQTIIDGENRLSLYVRTPRRLETNHSTAQGTIMSDTVPESRALTAVDIPLYKYRTGDTIHLSLTWAEQSAERYQIVITGESVEKSQLLEPLNKEPDFGYIVQIADIYLDPGMPGGKYSLTVLDDKGNNLSVMKFELIQAAVGYDMTIDQVPNPVAYTLGESINLVGYTLAETKVEAGRFIELTLYWRTDSPISSRYKVFTHVLGEIFNANTENFLWGQIDSEPVKGQALTTLWSPGSVIVDPYMIAVDAQAPPGLYVIEVGMYGLVDITRLPVSSPAGHVLNDAIQLVTIEVTQP